MVEHATNAREPRPFHACLARMDGSHDCFVLDGMDDSVFYLLLEEGGRPGRFLHANEAACTKLGYSLEEIRTFSPADINLPGTLERIPHLNAQTLVHKTVCFDTVHVAKDGTLHPVEIRARRIDHDGRPAILAVARDISDRKRAESERERLGALLAQSRKLESIGRIARGIAHDFNNALAVIQGTADLALAGQDPSQTPRDHLLRIREAASHATGLARQLLAFAREQPAAPRPDSLPRIVRATLPLLETMAGPGIRISFVPSPDPWNVFIDPSQIEQILANLCGNARDALEGRGEIRIEAENATIASGIEAIEMEVSPGEYVRLSVRDGGRGMDEATRLHVFEPFFTTKPEGKGSGLGLSIVHGIVKQNGGGIRVRSAPGEGAAFEILLPRHRGEADAAAPAPGPGCGGRRDGFVLLAEDDASMLRLCARRLEQLGYRVLPARSAEEALRLAAAHEGPVGLLVTDLGLPDMDGMELARRFHALHPDAGILLTSGSLPEESALQTGFPGRVATLPKPFSMELLHGKLQELLGCPPEATAQG